jgi:CheY-like chemotaxis protein
LNRPTRYPKLVASSPPKRRVLLVDDNQDARETLAELLRLWGFELATAADGPAAIATAAAFLPDSIVLDIGMPGMDGHELARRLRALPALESAVLIALTGHGDAETRRKSAEAGIDHHVLKPAQLLELRELLERPRANQA